MSIQTGNFILVDTSPVPTTGKTTFRYLGSANITYSLPTVGTNGVLSNDGTGILTWNSNSGASFGVQTGLPDDEMLVLHTDGTRKFSTSGVPIIFGASPPTIGVVSGQNSLTICAHNLIIRNAFADTQAKFIEISNGNTITIGSTNTNLKIGATGFANGTQVVGVDANGQILPIGLASSTFVADAIVRRAANDSTAISIGAISATTINATGLITASNGLTVSSGTLNASAIQTNTLTITGTVASNGLSPTSGSTFTISQTELLIVKSQSTGIYPTISLRNSDDTKITTLVAGDGTLTVNSAFLPSGTIALGSATARWDRLHTSAVEFYEGATSRGFLAANGSGISVSSSIVPSTSGSGTVGTSTFRWSAIHSVSYVVYDGTTARGTIAANGSGITTSVAFLPSGTGITLGASAAASQWSIVHARSVVIYDSSGGNASTIIVGASGFAVDKTIFPSTSGALNLGTATNQWSNIHNRTYNVYDSGGTLKSTLDATTVGLQVSSTIFPSANATHALGTAARQWSDIHSRQITIYDSTNVARGTIAAPTNSGLSFSSTIFPLINGGSSIGSLSLQWNQLHVRSVNFYTPAGATSGILDSNGSNIQTNNTIVPSSNAGISLGTSALRFDGIHLQTVNVYTSGGVIAGAFTGSGSTIVSNVGLVAQASGSTTTFTGLTINHAGSTLANPFISRIAMTGKRANIATVFTANISYDAELGAIDFDRPIRINFEDTSGSPDTFEIRNITAAAATASSATIRFTSKTAAGAQVSGDIGFDAANTRFTTTQSLGLSSTNDTNKFRVLNATNAETFRADTSRSSILTTSGNGDSTLEIRSGVSTGNVVTNGKVFYTLNSTTLGVGEHVFNNNMTVTVNLTAGNITSTGDILASLSYHMFNTSNSMFYNGGTTANIGGPHIAINCDGNYGLLIGANGNIQIRGNTAYKAAGISWTNPSDIRLKSNIETYNEGLETLLKLQPKKYNLLTSEYNSITGDKKYVGLIAQEVMEFYPRMISMGEDGYYRLNADDMLFMMINAIRELNAKITG